VAAATAVMTASTFLSIIRQNSLIDEEKLQAVLRTLSPAVLTGEDALIIADSIVENKLLTRFQANLLLQGKSKSLRITSKYRLLDRLGAGGMGLVYLCEHIRMKRHVALKVLPNSQAKEPGNLERFYREAQAVAALKHQNIVQAYDVDSDNGIHYLVMEYIDGVNLEKLVAQRGPLDPVRAAHYIAQAADGLQHAAERGLVHRDIKPSNLLLDREGYVKILDMGLARFFDTRSDNITERFDSNAVIGTADFISPEQALNSHDVDIRADIYSLGCTFYFALTGRAPFHEANITQKLLLHQIRDPQPLEELVPGIDPAIVDVVMKMMAKKPEDRFQLPGEVVGALVHWTQEPIEPPSRDELPDNPLTAMDAPVSQSTITNPGVTASMPRKAPRPSTGMMTERMTESAIRRMDGLPPRDVEYGKTSKRRWIIGSALVTLGIGALILVAAKPWEPKKPAVANKPNEEYIREDEPPPSNQQVLPLPLPDPKKKDTAPPPPKTQKLGSGFVRVAMDAKTARPGPQNADIRSAPTDIIFVTGADVKKKTRDDQPMLDVLGKVLVGGKGGANTQSMSIVPFLFANAGNQSGPNTLVAVTSSGLHPLALGPSEYFATTDFVGVKPEHNCLVRNSIALPGGATTVNAFVSELWDWSGAADGSTLKVDSGVVLFMGVAQKPVAFGAGTNPLTLDFNGRTGYLTLSSDTDMGKAPAKELAIRASLANLGNNPLVLSGLSGNLLRLDVVGNSAARLVVQGNGLNAKEKQPFRVEFTKDAQLGQAMGAILLNDAVLGLSGTTALEVNRPLTLNRMGQLSARNAKGQLRWNGKITGTRLGVTGSGTVVLTCADNDFSGGTEVWTSTLVLAAEDGTPLGSGNVVLNTNSTLTGAGKINDRLSVRAATFQPGSADGKSLILNGPMDCQPVLVKGKDNKESNRYPNVRFRLPNENVRPLIYTHVQQPLNLANAGLQFEIVGDWKPTTATKVYLITNRSGQSVVNFFRDAPHLGSVKSMDGKWTAKISYQGNSMTGTTTDGIDVVLYDFASLKP
jgi:serine/threonine protein kinase